MAFVKTANLVTTSGNTYATTAEWITEHGKCGIYNTEYVTNGTMDLLEETGITIVLTFPDEATSDAFTAAHADEIAAAAYTTTIVSEVTT
jgi:hypothetical protein|tara:strand:- start:4814 stop:5083 length:270 start_codon:yes stop_codon:yes gene_type:complete